jgi:hypothetical protein
VRKSTFDIALFARFPWAVLPLGKRYFGNPLKGNSKK